MTTAAVLAFGAATTGALAQDEPETPSSTSVERTPTSEPSAPPSTSESTPSSTTESVPPSSIEPSTPASTSESAPPPPAAEQPKNEPDDSAAVGSYEIRAVHDKNGNSLIEPGEEVSGLKVSFRDKQTGAAVAERTTGVDGRTKFTGLAVGSYWVTVDPVWKLTDGTAGFEAWVTESGSEMTLWLKPGVAAPSPRGTLWFEKASYESHETVRFWLTVTNVGGATAERVKLSFPILDVNTPENGWGDFSYHGAGIRLAPGESRTFEASGTIREFRDGKLVLWGGLDYEGRPDVHQSGYRGEVAVVQTKGSINGVVYTDKNRNGQQDAGEAAADAVVEVNGGAPYGYFKTTTDADGRYSFKDIPSGDYYVGYALAGGWIVHTDNSGSRPRVQPGAVVELIARAERPYHESLSATLTLDKDVYQVGEKAKITITITNSGDRELGNIFAWCNRIGEENQLGGRPGGADLAGWGDLIPPGKGVTVSAGETKTFIATEDVPRGALLYGKVIASCGFAPYAGWNTDAAEARDTARVPGGFGSLTGELFYDRNANWTVDASEAIGNTRIVLRDRELNVDVAETFSDDKGNVRFDGVPAGDYWAWIDGPWKFEGDRGGHVSVYAGREWNVSFTVVPGPAPVHDGGTTPAAAAPTGAGGAGTAEALAKTGASVLGLGLLGALLVAFGFGASIIGRRRQTA